MQPSRPLPMRRQAPRLRDAALNLAAIADRRQGGPRIGYPGGTKFIPAMEGPA